MNNTVQKITYEVNFDDKNVSFLSSIDEAINEAQNELEILADIEKTLESIKPDCDKIDYALAASVGIVCGMFDIFLVGAPGNSIVGNVTDKWFEDRTKDFAKLCGWDGGDKSSAIRHLENKFKVPYDQRGAGDAGSFVFNLTPTNHHFKSLAHNPTLLGLFFSVLDQFSNTSHFVSGGDLMSLQNADNTFSLRGKSLPGKLFCAFVNWFGHLISDISGSSSSKGRGMGIPSPLWTWSNSIIAIKRSLNIPVGQFDKYMNELAVELYENRYDSRFQTAQAIPVFINEITVRLIYSIRRLIKYFSETNKAERSFKSMWKKCEPFNNPTVKRMLTVAHGTFLAIDAGDATIRSFIAGGGTFNPVECCMRLNVVGVGRFAFSLFGEAKLAVDIYNAKNDVILAEKKKTIVENYIDGLKTLKDSYNDHDYVNFDKEIISGQYKTAFEKTVKLAEKRQASSDCILKNKSDIDNYFRRGK